jgi:hypothetical protein
LLANASRSNTDCGVLVFIEIELSRLDSVRALRSARRV